MKQNKIYTLLGLAMRGRNVVSGEYSTENAVRDGSAMLVIVAEDASDNTKKRFRDKCSFYEVPIHTYGTKEELGHAIGKEQRAVAAVTDKGLAGTLINHLEAVQNQEVMKKHGEN